MTRFKFHYLKVAGMLLKSTRLRNPIVRTCNTALSRCICLAFSKTNLQICKIKQPHAAHCRQVWVSGRQTWNISFSSVFICRLSRIAFSEVIFSALKSNTSSLFVPHIHKTIYCVFSMPSHWQFVNQILLSKHRHYTHASLHRTHTHNGAGIRKIAPEQSKYLHTVFTD